MLTLYELTQGDVVKRQEWAGMDEEMIQAALSVLVKNRKAQMFGAEGERGIKFF